MPPPPPDNLTPPPGYVAYGTNPTPSMPLRRVRGLSTAVVVLVAAAVLGTVAATILSFSAASDAGDFLDGSISQDDFESAIGPLHAAQLITGVATLAAGIVTIIWLYRIASNVRAFGRQTTFRPLFAIFGWFLPPFVLYIIPFLVSRELWKASEPGVVEGNDWKRAGENPVLWMWFITYGVLPVVIFAFQASSIAGGLGTGDIDALAETIEDFGALGVIAGVLTVIAGGAWIIFVRTLTDRHTQLTRES